MAIIKSFSPFQNLSNFQTFLVDDNPISDYFRITEFKDTFTGGKNGFLIEGSEFLKETTEVKIELLDVEGNPIYFEPGDGIPEYYEGVSKLVSCHVYDDTPIGLGKITILGELKNYVDDNGSIIPVPSEWKGVYNVKWERTFKVNKNLSNEDIVRFYKRPLVNIDELVKPIFTKSVNQVTDSESTVTGVAQLPNAGTDLSNYRGGTFYKLIKSSGTWDIDVDENVINVDVNGSTYSPKIIEVLNDREVLVDIPYTNSNNIVSNFTSHPYSVTYTDFQNETIGESALTGSFAKIDITQLKTFVGDVARVKVFRKSRSSANDFQFVQESRLESTELLRDITTTENTELSYGRFDQTNLERYWVTTSVDHPTGVDSSILSQAVKVDYNGSGVQKLITSQSFSISKDVEYTLNFRTLLSGSISDDKYLKAYFSGSYENGSPFTQNFVDITPDGSYVVRKNITENIIAQQNIDAKLVFEFKGDDWYISNVSLKNAQDTSFSPDEFTLIQDIPRKLASETFDFRFEFYDINNNYIPVNVVATKTFNGGNDFNTTSKLLTFESDRNAFRYISGSANPASQQIQFKTTIQNLTGSVAYFSSAFDEDGVYIEPTDWTSYPGGLTNPSNNGGLVTIGSFEGTWGGVDPKPEVYSIIYTASIEELEEFETIYRLEDGENAPTLLVSSNANQFIYEPTTLSPKPSGQSITIRAQRKNLATIDTPITIFASSSLGYEELSGSAEITSLGHPDISGSIITENGVSTYVLTATQFSASFAQNNFEEVTYEFTGSDVFGVEQTDEITISKVINFDGVSIVLSNESVSFPAYSTGLITASLAPSSGSVQMFIGGTQITHDDVLGDGLRNRNTFDITTVVGNGVVPTDPSPIDEFYSIQDFPSASDEGSLTLTIEYLAGDNATSQSFQKIVSYTKAKAAAPSVGLKATPGTQTITSSSVGYEIPQEVEIEVNEGGTDYVFSETLSSIRSYRIASITHSAGSVEDSNGIITLKTGSGEFTGAQYLALIDYKDSETTVIQNKPVKFDLNVNQLASSGSDAKTVKLTASQYRIEYDGDGNKTEVEVLLTATSQNFKIPEYRFLRDGIPVTQPEEWSTTSTYTIPDNEEPDIEEVNSWEVQVRELNENYSNNEVFDNIDIFALSEGSDAYTIFLTNEVHTFAAESTGKVTSTLEDGSFEIRLFRGIVEYDFDGTPSPADNTYSATVTSNNITFAESTTIEGRRKFTPTTGTWDSSTGVDSGTEIVTITDNANSKVFEKVYTFNKSKKAPPNVLVIVSPQSQTVDSGSAADDITISVKEGTTNYSYEAGILTENTFKISSVSTGFSNSASTISLDSNPTITTSGTATISYVNSEGIADSEDVSFTIGVAKQGKDGSGAANIEFFPQTQQLIIDNDGNYTPTPPSEVNVSVIQGGSEFTYIEYNGNSISSTLSSDSTYTLTNPTLCSFTAVGNVQPNSPAVNAAYTVTFDVTYKDNEGKISDTITKSHYISIVADGSTGPGIVFTGPWEDNRTYQYDLGNGRRDAVLYDGVYYATLASNTSVIPTTPGQTVWQDLGTEDFFVAAKIAIFEESFIKNTLNIGANNEGALSSANITLYGGDNYPYFSLGQSSNVSTQGYSVGDGVFIGRDADGEYKMSLENGTDSYLKWTGTELLIKGGITATSIAFNTGVTINESNIDGLGDLATENLVTETFIDNNSISTPKLKTNAIQGGGFDYTAGQTYSDQGSIFDLANGNIITPNFSVIDGNASFAGTLEAGTIMTNGTITGGIINGTEFTGATGTFSGNITSDTGNIGGWTIENNRIFTPIMALNSNRPALEIYSGNSLAVDVNSNTTLSSLTGGSNSTNISPGIDTDTATAQNFGWSSQYTVTGLTVEATATAASTLSTSGLAGQILTFTYDSVDNTNIIQNTLDLDNMLEPQQFTYYQIVGSATNNLHVVLELVDSGGNVAASISAFEFSSPELPLIGSTQGETYVQRTSSHNPNLGPKSTSFEADGGTYTVRTRTYQTASFQFFASSYAPSGYSSQINIKALTAGFSNIRVFKDVSKSELNAGGMQVVRSTTEYVIMDRLSSGTMLQVGGNITATGNITAYYSSDRRLKENIIPIVNPFDKINKIGGYEFDWKPSFREIHNSEGHDVGLIAQEIQKSMPELVGEMNGGFLGVKYEKLTVYLLEAVKNLNDRLIELEEENKKLKESR